MFTHLSQQSLLASYARSLFASFAAAIGNEAYFREGIRHHMKCSSS